MEQRVSAVCWEGPTAAAHPELMVSADALARGVTGERRLREAIALTERLAPDEYAAFMAKFYRDGLARFGDSWGFADIVTALIGLSDALRPENYLEIGVRRGRSACAVASKSPECAMYLFDRWTPGYAGAENPGPALVESELRKAGHRGRAEFFNGDSHKTLKPFFRDRPGLALDLVTVDGDHSDAGAREDLCDVLPRLKIGGAVVFDDVCHPKHLYLRAVWRDLVESDPRFTSWTYDGAGFGVGFALRRR